MDPSSGSTDELLNSWKVFTALKDESYDGRRLENAAWRLHAMQKLGKTPSFQAASQVTQGKCVFNKGAPISDQLNGQLQPQHPLDLGKALENGLERVQSRDHLMLDDSWAAKQLLGVCLKNKLSNETIEEVLQAGARKLQPTHYDIISYHCISLHIIFNFAYMVYAECP